jgi:hypothetical protein
MSLPPPSLVSAPSSSGGADWACAIGVIANASADDNNRRDTNFDIFPSFWTRFPTRKFGDFRHVS